MKNRKSCQNINFFFHKNLPKMVQEQMSLEHLLTFLFFKKKKKHTHILGYQV